ncbi:MAG: hypothetical protein ACREQK_17350 [Candidatus Binatia bacterium]
MTMRQLTAIVLTALSLGLLDPFDASARDLRASGRSVSESPKHSASDIQRGPRRFRRAPRVIIVYPYRYPYYHHFHYGPYRHFGYAAFDPELYPFFCSFHGAAFTSQAGFLDHVGGTHKVPLQQAVTLCAEDGSSCFFGY